jgi:hypothetical protein
MGIDALGRIRLKVHSDWLGVGMAVNVARSCWLPSPPLISFLG